MFEELGRLACDDFDHEVSQIPADLCAPFFASANRLDAGLIYIFRTVAICARAEEDLDKVASYWAQMVNLCDMSLQRLSNLKADHPHCGSEHFYDRLLDLKNKCQRLHQMHA